VTAPGSPASKLRLDPERAALLVVDVQERLWAVMDQDDRARCLKNVGILLELARRLGIPVVQSEQYPKGLGPTIAPIAEKIGAGARRLEKVEFSCAAAPAWAPLWDELRRPQWIVAGMEAHVCVYQTVRDLLERGATVHLPVDAVISRTRENRAVGLDLARSAGAILTSTEALVFDALRKAGSDDFRAMSRLVR
jgi:nicotinamidase-related amidase